MNTLRNHPWGLRQRLTETVRPAGPMPQSVYWRRRAVALVAVLAILSLIAWAFSGALGSGALGSADHAGSGGTSNSGTSNSGGSDGGGSDGGASTGDGGSDSGGAGGSSNGQRAAGAAIGAAAAGRVRACPSGAVVLSVFASQPAYIGAQLPEFTVDVVGTARSTCTFDVGARHVALVIRSGSHRVWSSADCAAGTGSLRSDLQRGVPTVIPISWNRQASVPGCTAPAAPAAAGTYTATAVDGALASNTITFRLG
jgi:hypothetical protein